MFLLQTTDADGVDEWHVFASRSRRAFAIIRLAATPLVLTLVDPHV